MSYRIDSLKAPLLVTWQITRDCDLACLHCCTDSAPGRRLRDELDEDAALQIAASLIEAEVPYVMLCGGEPLTVPHFFKVAETLGRAGVRLKIETNGQRIDTAVCERLARLPIRSIQVSLDGDSPETYAGQRAGGSLARAHAACAAVRAADMPLEITFAPTRINIHEADAVIERAAVLGAFRFNTGRLMRIGTAARLWQRLCPDAEQYRRFRGSLHRQRQQRAGMLDVCYEPFSMTEGLAASLAEPPATLLVMPNGQVKVAAALPVICADLRTDTVPRAWQAYRSAWQNLSVQRLARRAIADESSHAEANLWRMVDNPNDGNRQETTWIN